MSIAIKQQKRNNRNLQRKAARKKCDEKLPAGWRPPVAPDGLSRSQKKRWLRKQSKKAVIMLSKRSNGTDDEHVLASEAVAGSLKRKGTNYEVINLDQTVFSPAVNEAVENPLPEVQNSNGTKENSNLSDHVDETAVLMRLKSTTNHVQNSNEANEDRYFPDQVDKTAVPIETALVESGISTRRSQRLAEKKVILNKKQVPKKMMTLTARGKIPKSKEKCVKSHIDDEGVIWLIEDPPEKRD